MKTKQILYSVTLLIVFCALILAGHSYITKNNPDEQKDISKLVITDNPNSDSSLGKKEEINSSKKERVYKELKFLGEPKIDYFKGLKKFPQRGDVSKEYIKVMTEYFKKTEKPNHKLIVYQQEFRKKYMERHNTKILLTRTEKMKLQKELANSHPLLKQVSKFFILISMRNTLLTEAPRVHNLSGRIVDEDGNPVHNVLMKVTKRSNPNLLSEHLTKVKNAAFEMTPIYPTVDYYYKDHQFSTTQILPKGEFAVRVMSDGFPGPEIKLSKAGYYSPRHIDFQENTFGKFHWGTSLSSPFAIPSDPFESPAYKNYERQVIAKHDITKELLTVTRHAPRIVMYKKGKLTRLKEYDIDLTSHVDGSGTVMTLKDRRDGVKVKKLSETKKLPKTCIIFTAKPNSKGIFPTGSGFYNTCKQLPDYPANDTYNAEFKLTINDPDPTAGFYLVDPLKKGKYHCDQRMRTAPETGYVRELVFGPDHEYQQGSFYVKLGGRYGKVRMPTADYIHFSKKEARCDLTIRMQMDGSRNLEMLNWFSIPPRLMCKPPGT